MATTMAVAVAAGWFSINWHANYPDGQKYIRRCGIALGLRARRRVNFDVKRR